MIKVPPRWNPANNGTSTKVEVLYRCPKWWIKVPPWWNFVNEIGDASSTRAVQVPAHWEFPQQAQRCGCHSFGRVADVRLAFTDAYLTNNGPGTGLASRRTSSSSAFGGRLGRRCPMSESRRDGARRIGSVMHVRIPSCFAVVSSYSLRHDDDHANER